MSDADYILAAIQRETDELRNTINELRSEVHDWINFATDLYSDVYGFTVGYSVLEEIMKNHISGTKIKTHIDSSLILLEHNLDQRLVGMHDSSECSGKPCPFHNKTDHSLRKFPQVWRSDLCSVERLCEHGYTHPDPDSPWPEKSEMWEHDCDGCCSPNERPSLTPVE